MKPTKRRRAREYYLLIKKNGSVKYGFVNRLSALIWQSIGLEVVKVREVREVLKPKGKR